MPTNDLRSFLDKLSNANQLKQIQHSVDPHLEMTEISRRVLQDEGPALLFEAPKNFNMPVLTNLFGHTDRICQAFGVEDLIGIREIGKLLAFLKEPNPPKGLREAWKQLPIFKQVLNMAPKIVNKAVCQRNVLRGEEVDLTQLPIQTCWPEDAAPLITWGLVITEGPQRQGANLGIYRQQVLGKNQLIMRWLAHRGGALDYQAWCNKNPGQPFPIAVAIGADPATTLAAVTPLPESLSEYAFAGLLRSQKTELVRCQTNTLQVPASAEIILEGFIQPGHTAPEGPFGDHTGYYNEVEEFPVFTVECITTRDNPIYHSTYTGRPPDEPAMLGLAFNELFIPLLQKQFPEIIDFYLPPEACSYRMAVISIRKQYAGHAKRIMMATWSWLKQFMYTKFVIVVDEDIDCRDWRSVMWAISTRSDPKRDTLLLEDTPIDYLDFAAPKSNLGGKMGIDATNKWSTECDREWGKPIQMDPTIIKHIDDIWEKLDL